MTEIKQTYSYDDILLVPGYSEVLPGMPIPEQPLFRG